MKNKSNKYLQLVSSIVGEPNERLAIAFALKRFRSAADTLSMIAARLGVDAIKEEPLPFDGGVFDIGGRLIIKVNSLTSPSRRKFTLAHELGHLLVERLLSVKRRSGCVASSPLEEACDAFAAELLMPYEDIIPFVSNLGFQSPEKLGVVARRYGVSLHAAAARVHKDLGLWRRPIGLWDYDSSAKELWFVGKRPWSTKQPSFAAFGLAKQTSKPVCTNELFAKGCFTEPVSLKMLHLGRNKILGMVSVRVA